ncbi:TetR/AcrR family transcriptional regulator [Hymenobacter sp. DH14]|uniref:TetR/AcrR family transcriptional regulator n=1 Tax=Hymenobacter cyanobacteriorum TaxID=2926463 RepID=A0A9X2AGQ9_9BACT|nr:TetR/AcrR family transcriptional regulator [Hymenobacter cyanobacteriorum]MCI1187928.1 TetR/AcrR family transcriptional regulator [Hymenobacter cyanobacteriorum]
MATIDAPTRDRILTIASEVFYQKGLSGARMQEIADQAGINKALLHYYFKSKEQLFDTVFQRALGEFLGGIGRVLNGEVPLRAKIEQYVAYTTTALAETPALAAFIVHELQQHPERLSEQFGSGQVIDFEQFRKQLAAAGPQFQTPNAAEHFFANMVALCVYPVLAAPLLAPLMHQAGPQYRRFLRERATQITQLLLGQL